MNNLLKYIGIFMLFLVAGYFGMIVLAPSQVKVVVNEDIDAPISEVFDATTNVNRLNNWIIGVKTAKQIKGNGASVGGVYRLFFEGKGEMIMEQKITEIEVNSLYSYRGEVKEFMEVNSTMTFEALDSNHTRISNTIILRPLSNRMKLFMHAEDTHKKNAAAKLTKLKEYLEI